MGIDFCKLTSFKQKLMMYIMVDVADQIDNAIIQCTSTFT